MQSMIGKINLVFLLLFFSLNSTALDKISKEDGYFYLATFNVYKLGTVDAKYTSMDEDSNQDIDENIIPERIKNIADIVAIGEFDLIAFQEVTYGPRGEAAFNDLIKDLQDRYNLKYKVKHSDYIGQGLMAEMISFLYRPEIVEPKLSSKYNAYTYNIDIDGRDLVASSWKVGSFDFTAISAHLAWGNEEDRIDGFYEINQILHHPQRYSIDPDIIILGDFNRFGDNQDSVLQIDYDPVKILAPNITIFDSQFNTQKKVTKSNIIGKNIPNNNPQFLSTTVAKNTFVYDGIYMTADVSEELGFTGENAEYGTDFGIIVFDEVGGFGFQAGANKLDHNTLKNLYSDHRPLWMRFKTTQTENLDETILDDTYSVHSYYATPYGRKYHLHNCPTIRGKATPKTWKDKASAEDDSYTPCRICKP
jgi:endonuclease/exonuclease/phosphatase family metal-dependent hydrolase